MQCDHIKTLHIPFNDRPQCPVYGHSHRDRRPESIVVISGEHADGPALSTARHEQHECCTRSQLSYARAPSPLSQVNHRLGATFVVHHVTCHRLTSKMFTANRSLPVLLGSMWLITWLICVPALGTVDSSPPLPPSQWCPANCTCSLEPGPGRVSAVNHHEHHRRQANGGHHFLHDHHHVKRHSSLPQSSADSMSPAGPSSMLRIDCNHRHLDSLEPLWSGPGPDGNGSTVVVHPGNNKSFASSPPPGMLFVDTLPIGTM